MMIIVHYIISSISISIDSDTITQIITSAVKRLKYLIAINRINVIVNLRLTAINHKFVSILNVDFFLSHYFFQM